jgi:hypothetical protein
MPSPCAGVSTSSNAARASSNCFWESNPFCDVKLRGASCDHPFVQSAVMTIASLANGLKSLLTILPPNQDLQARRRLPLQNSEHRSLRTVFIPPRRDKTHEILQAWHYRDFWI